MDGWRRSRRKEGREGEGADDEEGGEAGKQLQARLQPVVLQNVLVDKAQPDGEDGAAGGDNPVDDAHPLLEVVAKDGEGGGVDQASAGPKHDAIGEVQNLHLVKIWLNLAISRQDTCLYPTRAERPIPVVARQEPTTAVALSPILSLRMPTRKERKKVVPMVREPTREHLADASSTPFFTISFFSSTKRMPKVLMIPKMIPLTRKQALMTNHA